MLKRWRSTRRVGGAGAAALIGAMLVSAAVGAQSSPAATDGPDQPRISKAEAVSLVSATDLRFAGLPDYEDLRRVATEELDPYVVLVSDYFQALPTTSTLFSEAGFLDFRYQGNWLIEVTLVRDCTTPDADASSSGDSLPAPDPCEWRHSWFYRVQPGGTVSLMFDEGDPDQPTTAE